MSSKFSPAYWKSRIKRRGAGWATQVSHDGQRHWVTVQAESQRAAARLICDAYIEIKQTGWEARKPSLDSDHWTIEEFIEACRTVSTVRSVTFRGYSDKLKQLTKEACGAQATKVRLSALIKPKILAWQVSREQKGFKRSSTNTIICLSRALWGPTFQEPLGLKLESPFIGIKIRKTSTRYRSTIDLAAILKAALLDQELSDAATSAILLAGSAGLRRAEIDALEWNAFDWEAGILKIRDTAVRKLKTEDSAGDIALDSSVLAFFRERRSSKGFVIPNPSEIAKNPFIDHLRTDHWMREATRWLRNNGVDAHKPLHTLRKEVGAILTTRHGIYAASRFLRHSDVGVTAAYYADQKERVSAGLEI